MLKRLMLGILFLVSLAVSISAQTYGKIQGYAQKGGQKISVSGLSSTNFVQQSFPSCTITVYNSGTLTLSTIYSDSIGTPKSNPFTADSTAYFFFYGSVGSTFDIKFSGTGITTPFTLGGYIAGVGTVTGLADPMTTRGDIIYRNSSNTTDRLGRGLADTFLSSNGTDISYSNSAKLYDKGGTVYNVKAYGAICDGTTDDSTSIQSTFTAAGNRGIISFEGCKQTKITTTITVGNGSISAQSTINSVTVIGAGMGASTSEGPVNQGGTEILWYGAASGIMMQVNGPIFGVHIEGLHFNCQPSTNAAATALKAIHPYSSTFKRLSATLFTGPAFIATAYSNPTGLAQGANNNYWEQIKTISGAGSSAKGIEIGETTTGSTPFLDVAGNVFVKCYFNVGTTAGQIGIDLRFTDYLTFIDCSTLAPTGGGVRVVAVTGNTAFPGDIVFVNSSIGGGTGVSGSWTPDQKISFINYPVGEGQPIPTNSGFAGITSAGQYFGTFTHRDLETFSTNPLITNSAPGLVFTDTTASAKSLTISVDADKAQIRESAGAAGSLLSFDLANNRIGIGTNTPERILTIKDPSAPGVQLSLNDTQFWLFYAGAGTANAGGFSIFDDTANLDRFAVDALTGNVIVTQKLGVGLAINATPFSQLEVALNDAVTNTTSTIGTFDHNSSGTPSANFGAQLLFNLKSTTTNDRNVGTLSWYWTVATDASRSSAVKIQTLSSTALADSVIFDYVNGHQFNNLSSTAFSRVFAASPGSVNRTADFGLSGFNGATGDGPRFLFFSPDSAGNKEFIGGIGSVYTTATNGSEAADMIFYVRNGGAAVVEAARLDSLGRLLFTGITFANLGTPSNGAIVYCSDCANASNPCTNASTGAFAKRLNGAWDCR